MTTSYLHTIMNTIFSELLRDVIGDFENNILSYLNFLQPTWFSNLLQTDDAFYTNNNSLPNARISFVIKVFIYYLTINMIKAMIHMSFTLLGLYSARSYLKYLMLVKNFRDFRISSPSNLYEMFQPNIFSLAFNPLEMLVSLTKAFYATYKSTQRFKASALATARSNHASIYIQKHVRARDARRKFATIRNASILIQKHARAQAARRTAAAMR